MYTQRSKVRWLRPAVVHSAIKTAMASPSGCTLSDRRCSGFVQLLVMLVELEVALLQGAKETEVCGDGTSHRCFGGADQGHEQLTEPASCAAGMHLANARLLLHLMVSASLSDECVNSTC